MWAAQYPPRHQGEDEQRDHALLRAAVASGINVTVWREAEYRSHYAFEGVEIRQAPQAAERFYADIARRLPERVLFSGSVSVEAWKIPPATRPVLLLRRPDQLPLVRQLAPILDAIVVPSRDLFVAVTDHQPTFPTEQIHIAPPDQVEQLVHTLRLISG